jgi:hypothetical protein
MKFFKRLALRVALNREQRIIIWRALIYSEYKCRQHGNANRAVAVRAIISQVKEIFGVELTKEEINAVYKAVYDATCNARRSRSERVMREVNSQSRRSVGLAVGDVVEIEEPADAAGGENATATENGNEEKGASDSAENN